MQSTTTPAITFVHPENDQFKLIYDWFNKPHVNEYLEKPESNRMIPDLKNYLEGEDYFLTPWLAYAKGKPFAYITTAEVQKNESGIWSKWREKKGKTYSMDILIGEDEFLGKGMSHILIQKFIEENFKDAAAFLIDPELRNIHAIHVYEKAGFIIVDEFKVEHGPNKGIPHLMMKLKLSSSEKL